MNGGVDRLKEKGNDPYEEDNLKHSVRFRRRLSPIGSSSDSDEEDPKSEVASSSIYSASSATLKEAHEEAKRRRDAVASADKPPLPTNPEETKFTFTATLPPDSRTWNELTNLSSQDTPFPDPNPPPSPMSIHPTSTFSRRAIPNDTVPPRPSSLPSTPKYRVGSPGSQSQESFFPSTTPSSNLPTTSPPLPYPLIPRRPPMPSATIPSPQAIALSSPGAGPSSGKRWLGSAPESPSLASYIAPEELEISSSKLYRDYFDLPTDVKEGPSGFGSGSVDKETNHDEYEGMKELPKDERGRYVEDDESDTDFDFSDLGEGTSTAGLFGLAARQTDSNGTLKPPEPIPERRESVEKELEDDFDPRDFPTYFADGALDPIKERDRNSDNLFFSDSEDEDDDAQDLGHLDHMLGDGAPVGLRIREVHPGAAENLAEGAGGVGQQNGVGNGVVNPPANEQVGPLAPAQEVNEEVEPNLDDDMEGAMEAIGLRGPVLTVLQNVGVVII
jgi:E3 ubiquitin-protein ligase MARCH6